MGACVPEKIVTNKDIEGMGLGTTDEWIQSRTGISERRILEPGQGVSSLAIEAAKQAMLNSKTTPEEIGLVIVATTTPDYSLFPSVACLVQAALALPQAAAFDLSAACSGFAYALETGAQFIRSGMYTKVLVIGADALSRYVDWQDRGVCILFGDGAGAAVLGRVKSGYGILASELRAEGAEYRSLYVPVGGTKTPLTAENMSERNHFIKMDGAKIFKFAVRVTADTIEKILMKANLKKEDISLLVMHQANIRIINYAAEKFGLSSDKVYVNISRYGNTSAASIPLVLDEAVKNGRLKHGDIVVIMGFGAGLTWGASVIKWVY